jgi:hypothetical protein
LVLPLLAALGCGTSAVTEKRLSNPEQEAGGDHDPTTAGTILGRVVWDDELPVVPPFEVMPNPLAGELLQRRQVRPNPNAPLIEPGSKGVASAVVFLRGIDPRHARPWDHPPVQVEQRNGEFHIVQGGDSHFGFVRRGDDILMVSRDRFFHSLHAGGAAYFTLTFPDPDRALQRALNEKGIVELSSAAGYFWMRAYLFVDDHPYYTRTDALGRFVLPHVPPGSYEVVCWMPNWREARHERDPESGLFVRIFFDSPVSRVQRLTLLSEERKQTTFVVSTGLFAHWGEHQERE